MLGLSDMTDVRPPIRLYHDRLLTVPCYLIERKSTLSIRLVIRILRHEVASPRRVGQSTSQDVKSTQIITRRISTLRSFGSNYSLLRTSSLTSLQSRIIHFMTSTRVIPETSLMYVIAGKQDVNEGNLNDKICQCDIPQQFQC